jgi:hypothetical protein
VEGDYVFQSFDFSLPYPAEWEVEAIRDGARRRQIIVSDHAFDEAREEGIPIGSLNEVILNGEAVEKDLPGNTDDRAPGIAFEGSDSAGRHLKVKVTEEYGYLFATVHYVKPR